MNVTSKISVDLTRQNVGQRVNAVQGDGNTRYVEITLLSGGVPWTPPDGMEAAIAYMQPSGTKGLYNKLADGTAAISITGNVATVILAPQMLTVSGTVQASLVFNDSQLNRLTTFPFAVSVTSNPAAGAQKTEDYIRLQWLEDKLDEYLKKYDGLTDDAIVRRIVDEYLTANPPEVTETDPTVPAWAKQPQKPTYTAAEVGALPDTYTPPDQTAQQVGALAVSGGDVTGEIRMNGQPISGLNDPTEETQAARKVYVDAAKAEANAYTDASVRKAAPRNLLDNSDWRKPSGIVNQRGETTYSGNKYTIDRWRTHSGKATVTIGSGYLEITDALMQFLDIDPDMVYTAAVCKADGSVVLTSGTFRAGFGNLSLGIRCSYTNSLCRFLMESSIGNLAWAALYEGEYTADNLPVYQPKGYMTELAECQRYYQRVGRLLSTGAAATGFMFNNTSARFVMSISPMRKNNPTVNLVSSASKPSVISNGNVLAEGALTFTTNAYKDDQHLVIAVTVSGGTQYANAVLVSDKDCYFEISADL